MTEYTDKVDQEKEFSLKQAEAFLKSLQDGTRPDPVGVVSYCYPLGNIALADAYQPIEALGQTVRTVLMDSFAYGDVRSFMRDILDITVEAEWLKQGCRARLWGAYIITLQQQHNPPGVVYVLGDRDPVVYTRMIRQ